MKGRGVMKTERMKSATLFFDDSEDSKIALEAVKKLEEIGFKVDYWDVKDLGEINFQPPRCLISPRLRIPHDPRWIPHNDFIKWIPLDNLQAIIKAVQSALSLARAQSG